MGKECFSNLAPGTVARAYEEDADRSIGHLDTLLGCLTNSGNGQFEVDQFPVEAVEIVALTGYRGPLGRDQRRQVDVDPAALHTEPGQAASVLGTEAKPSETHDEAESAQII